MTAINPHRGTVRIELDGRPHVLRYTWEAIARLQAAGLDGSGLDRLETLAAVAAAGLADAHPDVTAADVMRASPAIVPTTQAVETAFRLAYFGPEGAPEREPGSGAEGDGKKKTRWRRLWTRLWPAGSGPRSSGR